MSIQVIHIKYKCHIGDIHLHTGEFLIELVRKLILHEIDLDDNDSLIFGPAEELDKFHQLIMPYKDKILYKITSTSLKIIETEFGLSAIDVQYLQEFLNDNTTANTLLDKINMEGMDKLSKIEMEILNFHSRL